MCCNIFIILLYNITKVKIKNYKIMAEVRIDLSEFEAIKDAKNKAEDDLKELKQSHKEEISDLKNTIKDLENKSRVIIKHENKYFAKIDIDKESLKNMKNDLKHSLLWGDLDLYSLLRCDNIYMSHEQLMDRVADAIVNQLNKGGFKQASKEMIPLFSEHGEPDQYIGFDDIKLDVEKELKEQYINNQKKIQEDLEQQIKNYEDKYQIVEADVMSKYNSKIRTLEEKLNSSQEEVDKLKESHKEEVDKLNEDINKLKDELKEAQKTQEEKILEAEEKLKEAQEVLKKLTNNPRKKWYQFWK